MRGRKCLCFLEVKRNGYCWAAKGKKFNTEIPYSKDKTPEKISESLDLVEGHNITTLNVFIGRFSSEMFLDQVINRNKVINNG